MKHKNKLNSGDLMSESNDKANENFSNEEASSDLSDNENKV